MTILEYKSPVDSAFRPGDMLRLLGYGVLYHRRPSAMGTEHPGAPKEVVALTMEARCS